MRKLIAAHQSSGKTAKQFCQENDLKHWTFSYWKRKLRDSDSKQAKKKFVEIKAKPKVRIDSACFKVLVGAGIGIEIPPSFDQKALRSLVEVLKSC
jgi:hypothetical protein